LKTGNGESRSWVQIPPHPFFARRHRCAPAAESVRFAGLNTGG
jgi:hypothetical protein